MLSPTLGKEWQVKLATSLAAALLLVCSGAVFATGPNPGNSLDLGDIQAQKDAHVWGTPDPQPQQGGEDIATAANIPGLPYSDSGTTCGYINNYDESCPFTGGTAPDVVYKYSPAADIMVDIDLCTSLYDTKVYVYENDEFTPIGCNDDACGDDGWKSELIGVSMTAGNTYYIVVDGYGSASCGTYNLNVTEFVPCVECPPDGVDEGEPYCGDDYDDQFNGGCNSTPPVFSSTPCTPDGSAVTICGVGGGFSYFGSNYRDTDWYLIEAANNPTGVTACFTPDNMPGIVGYITVQPCENVTAFDDYILVDACTTGCISLPAGGEFWIFAGTSSFGPSVGCHPYNLEITGYTCGSVAVEPATWGEVKGLYR
jgi:hypothetical protein